MYQMCQSYHERNRLRAEMICLWNCLSIKSCPQNSRASIPSLLSHSGSFIHTKLVEQSPLSISFRYNKFASLYWIQHFWVGLLKLINQKFHNFNFWLSSLASRFLAVAKMLLVTPVFFLSSSNSQISVKIDVVVVLVARVVAIENVPVVHLL